MSIQTEKAIDRHRRLERIIQDMTEIIDNLRLSITYLAFDLEATRRENRQLRDLLKEHS